MYADTESCVNLVTVDQPSHTHQHQMEVVYSRGLDYPIDTTSHVLKVVESRKFIIYMTLMKRLYQLTLVPTYFGFKDLVILHPSTGVAGSGDIAICSNLLNMCDSLTTQ